MWIYFTCCAFFILITIIIVSQPKGASIDQCTTIPPSFRHHSHFLDYNAHKYVRQQYSITHLCLWFHELYSSFLLSPFDSYLNPAKTTVLSKSCYITDSYQNSHPNISILLSGCDHSNLFKVFHPSCSQLRTTSVLCSSHTILPVFNDN
jgi:hypothetical protein